MSSLLGSLNPGHELKLLSGLSGNWFWWVACRFYSIEASPKDSSFERFPTFFFFFFFLWVLLG